MNIKLFFIGLVLFCCFAGTSASQNTPASTACDYLGQTPPGDIPELFAPGTISTGVEHSSALFTPDCREIWFGRMFPAAIWVVSKENGRWSQPRLCDLSPDYRYLYPCISPDGNKIFFTSSKPVELDGQTVGRGGGDIWVIERTKTGWSQPRHLGDKINFGRRHSPGSVSNTGTLYYSVRTAGRSKHTTNLYRARLIDGRYTAPENLVDLNTDGPEHSPFVAPDEDYVIFSSFRGGQGLSDLFISFRTADGGWTTPKNIGRRINSGAKEEYPYVTPDGKYLFFNSNKVSSRNKSRIPDGPGNIYWVSAGIIEELRPTEPE